jgi:hypothetical protein
MPVPPGDDGGATPDASSGATPDASTGPTPDAGSFGDDSSTPMSSDSGPPPSYDGEIPIYYGPDPGPAVQMQCPGDPTQGWTEYKDTFHVEHPYTLPTNARFNITGGIYNFWIFPNDPAHAPGNTTAPRTEAKYGGLYDMATGGAFTTGMRMWTADMFLESTADGSAVMQIHTTTTGGGPVGLRLNGGNLVNNGNLTAVTGSKVPGGLVSTWFNMKVAFDAATLQVQIYINNCLQTTYTGPRGDGHFYFKNGVYGCFAAMGATLGCRDHYKNIHLYTK